MQISTLIEQLRTIQNQHGDLEVLITDGFEARCYRCEYAVQLWDPCDGTPLCADIGIGGCLED